MKNISNLRNKHLNKEIWIIGTGKSLDDFPKKFFDDKITIGLNGAICKYDTTYYFALHKCWWKYIVENKIDILIKSIYETRIDISEKLPKIIKKYLYKMYSINVLHSWHFTKKDISKMFLDIENGERNIIFLESGTVAHTAIGIAFFLGANRITLVGCENKIFEKNEAHADIDIEYPYASILNKNPWQNPHPQINIVMRLMAEQLKKQGYSLRRYYNKNTEFYKKGYEKINE